MRMREVGFAVTVRAAPNVDDTAAFAVMTVTSCNDDADDIAAVVPPVAVAVTGRPATTLTSRACSPEVSTSVVSVAVTDWPRDISADTVTVTAVADVEVCAKPATAATVACTCNPDPAVVARCPSTVAVTAPASAAEPTAATLPAADPDATPVVDVDPPWAACPSGVAVTVRVESVNASKTTSAVNSTSMVGVARSPNPPDPDGVAVTASAASATTSVRPAPDVSAVTVRPVSAPGPAVVEGVAVTSRGVLSASTRPKTKGRVYGNNGTTVPYRWRLGSKR